MFAPTVADPRSPLLTNYVVKTTIVKFRTKRANVVISHVPLYCLSAAICVDAACTCNMSLTRSMGATAVFDTAAEIPPAKKSLAKPYGSLGALVSAIFVEGKDRKSTLEKMNVENDEQCRQIYPFATSDAERKKGRLERCVRFGLTNKVVVTSRREPLRPGARQLFTAVVNDIPLCQTAFNRSQRTPDNGESFDNYQLYYKSSPTDSAILRFFGTKSLN